jgi:hypothetical protein
MAKSKSRASNAEWRELEELVDSFCQNVSDLKRSVGRLETKVIRLKTKRFIDPIVQPSPQGHVPVP